MSVAINAVKQERIRRGLTMGQAAAEAGVSHVTWRRIEAGQPVRDMTWSGVDRLFGLAPGAALSAVSSGSDLRDVLDAGQRKDPPVTEIVAVRHNINASGEDHYPADSSWRVDDRGSLRITGPGEKALATYPQGSWLRVSVRQLPEKSS